MHLWTVFLFVVWFSSCGKTSESDNELGELFKRSLLLRKNNIMSGYMDISVDPCDDFYKYSCGNYYKFLPRGELVFDSVITQLSKRMCELIPELLSGQLKKGSAKQKAKTFYNSCRAKKSFYLNKREIKNYAKTLGLSGIFKTNWKSDKFDWLSVAAHLELIGDVLIFGNEVNKSPFSEDMILYTGLGQPIDLSQSFIHSIENSTLGEGYVNLRKLILQQMGASRRKASEMANDILKFEIGKLSIYEDDYEQYASDYEIRNFSTFKNQYSKHNWDKYFKILFGHPIPDDTSLVVKFEKYFALMLDYVSNYDKKVLASYFLTELVVGFNSFFLYGLQTPEICGVELATTMPQVLTAAYAEKYYNERKANEVDAIFDNIRKTVVEEIRSSSKFDNETLIGAEKKALQVGFINGYFKDALDNYWVDETFKDLHVTRNNFIRNLIAINSHFNRMSLNRIGKPAQDSLKYSTDLFNFNSFYDLGTNTLIIPIGAQQLPIFSHLFPKSLIYSSIGFLIGHEFTHAFDTSRRKFDSFSSTQNWLSKSADPVYSNAAKCVQDSYRRYNIYIKNDESVATKKRIDENMSDNEGLIMAYKAYQRWMNENPNSEEETLPGLNFTSTQLFFLSFAQIWCSDSGTPLDRLETRYDVHNPNAFRVLGPLSNFDGFAKEFNCPVGSKMNPEKKCSLW